MPDLVVVHSCNLNIWFFCVTARLWLRISLFSTNINRWAASAWYIGNSVILVTDFVIIHICYFQIWLICFRTIFSRLLVYNSFILLRIRSFWLGTYKNRWCLCTFGMAIILRIRQVSQRNSQPLLSWHWRRMLRSKLWDIFITGVVLSSQMI